ncbi:MAG: hypothetical protein FJ146_04460 [Deltaproteobacteria bacterium]|nr:hypothetical protein [Deltaproteobacteria bacterium]
MKPGLLILPFLAVLVAALGTAVGSALPEHQWILQLTWALSATIVTLWVIMDIDNFKLLFQRKGAKYGASSGLVVLLGTLIIVGVAVLAARPRFNKSVDLSRDKLNTLSDQSVKVVQQIKDTGDYVAVKVFTTDEKVATDLRDTLNLYQAKGAVLKIEFIDPRSNPTAVLAAKITDPNTAIFTYKGQEKRLTAFSEEKVTNALVSVLKNKTKKVYFTKGHGEGALKGSDATGFGQIAAELEGNKDNVEELSLLETAKIPEDADLVVIPGPKYEFKEEETRILEDYLKQGGALLVMTDALVPVSSLNKLLEKFGLKYQDDLLILAPNDIRAQMIGQNNAIVSEFDEFSPISKDFSRMSQVQLVFRNTRSLEELKENVNKFKVEMVGKTSKDMIRVKNVKSASDLENLTEDRWETGSFPVIAVSTGKAQAPALATASSDDKATKTDAAKGEGAPKTKETRIVATGSVDFAANQGAQLAEHRDMFLNMTNFLLQDEDFISIRPKDPTKSTIQLTSAKSQLVLLFLAFIYPFVFLGGGTLAWLKRRRA